MDEIIKQGAYPTYRRSKERIPYVSELGYFASAPSVAGMATEDNRVILNPFSNSNRDAVYQNELSRLVMRNQFPASFSLTDQQNNFLNGNSYKYASDADRKATIAARFLSGDPSAGNQTFEQNVYVNKLKKLVDDAR